ncbi:hypothetical protein PAL_GLEAN10016158 [Pteropus alecto]|uniref:Uncharacterized protein n=1 Tax=Pteropus alecto TaxID=9402 RepID=L5KUG6_PTEAL|nr:hypothetical protein PAL_GLEAN10016158 [Pteropus alecto]
MSRGLPGRCGQKESVPQNSPDSRDSPYSMPHRKYCGGIHQRILLTRKAIAWEPESGQLRVAKAPAPSTADPLFVQPQPLAVSETHAPPGLDGPIFESFSGGASPPEYDRT